MELAGYVIKAVVVEGRSVAEVAAAHVISRSWLYELLARYRQGGEEGLKSARAGPGRRRPRCPQRSRTRSLRCASPSPRRASTPEPTRSTTTSPAEGTPRCRRWPPSGECCPGGASSSPSRRSALAVRGSGSMPSCPTSAGRPTRPLPAAGRLPSTTLRTSTSLRSARAQCVVKYLARQPVATTLGQLQDQLDRFASYYRTVRTHRALGRRTPADAFAARTKATPRSRRSPPRATTGCVGTASTQRGG